MKQKLDPSPDALYIAATMTTPDGRLSRLPATVAVLVFFGAAASTALANHGPGTSGGGSATAPGETLKRGRFDLSLREDYTQFQHINRAGAERRAAHLVEYQGEKVARRYLQTLSAVWDAERRLLARRLAGL